MARIRGFLTINNIVEAADENFELVLDEVQEMIDGKDIEIPDETIDGKNLKKLQTLLSYYSNTYTTLIGLWGALRHAADKNSKRIAARDYLEKAVSGCKMRYEAASRLLTSFQIIKEDT